MMLFRNLSIAVLVSVAAAQKGSCDSSSTSSSNLPTAFVTNLPSISSKKTDDTNTSFHRVGTLDSPSLSFVRNVNSIVPTVLFAKKKKDTTVGKGGKIQVKLLKHIAGTGQAGDIISVAPAFFRNKLEKSGSAIRISDEEVEQETAEKKQKDAEERASANDMKEKIESMTLNLKRKAGPEGHLFGGIGYKIILGELKNEFPKGALDAKYIKITQVKGEDGKVLKHDIKDIGEYEATISLLKGISATFKVSVVAEE